MLRSWCATLQSNQTYPSLKVKKVILEMTVMAPLSAAHKNKVQGANVQVNVAKIRNKTKTEQANIIFLPAVFVSTGDMEEEFTNLMKNLFQVKEA